MTENIVEWYKSSFEKFEQSLNGERNSPQHALRRYALKKFEEIGFPTPRHEEWRFTNIQPLLKVGFEPVTKYTRQDVDFSTLADVTLKEAIHLVILDGFFSPELSDISGLPRNVIAESLATSLKTNRPEVLSHLGKYVRLEENAFTALSSAFLNDGVYICIPAKCILEKPIQVLFLSSKQNRSFLTQPRNLFVLGEGAQATIVETYVSLGENQCLTNVVSEFVLAKNARLEHDRLQLENSNAFQINTTNIFLNASSTYQLNFIILGGAIVRNNITTVLDAEGIECTLNGLSLGTGTQLIDNHTSIDHAKPHCNSHQIYKSILDGKARGVFNGKIFVRKDAQKTDAKQTNKTLLLSDDATINTKPQLEIFADDVKCTHGATVGQLDAGQIFYLRTRGLDLATARDMLTVAFANEIVNHISVEELRLKMESLIHSRLGQGRKEAAL